MAGINLKLGLDLDGVITETPEFFSAWTPSWPGGHNHLPQGLAVISDQELPESHLKCQ